MLGFSQDIADRQILGALEGTAWIHDHVAERTPSGATKDGYVKRGSSAPCALAPKAGGEYLGVGGRAQKVSPGNRIDERRDDLIVLPAGTSISQRDRIEIEGIGTFEVTDVPERSTEIALEIEARELGD